MELSHFFQENPKAALAFSGGVDSAYLLYAGKKYGADLQAYYVKSPFQPQFELDDALRLAKELDVTMTVLQLDVLQDSQVAANPANRCYYCKKRIFSAILEAAKADGYTLILDGTNASDQVSDRPGMQALKELSVRSPLREAGLTKAEIRMHSKEAGLFTHNKPAYACLATRIPTGTAITAENLARTEWAEGYLRQLGFVDFRIRQFHDCARIQLPEDQLNLVLQHRKEIIETLKARYPAVLLDLEVRSEQ